jgi:hypothetical protein
MSDSARSSCGLSARTILIGCSLAQSRSGPAAVVVARGGMNASARSCLRAAARDFPTLSNLRSTRIQA